MLDRLKLAVPIVQAPMAGVSTPEMAAAVSNAGGLGSIALGAADVKTARAMILALKAQTHRAFNVNVFVHASARSNQTTETSWLAAMTPLFRSFGAEPPAGLRTIYKSFNEDEEMRALLVELAPPVVSFHFGLPDPEVIAILKSVGCYLLATATNLVEAEAAASAGLDAVVAQGFEAGGHRGVFDLSAPDCCLSTLVLTRLLALRSRLPVIAAGGIMDGHGISAALSLGAVAAQLGTAFIACPESSAEEGYRKALLGPGAMYTVMTTAISGRPARCLKNRFTVWGDRLELSRPDYPIAYDAGKALHAAAKAAGEFGFGAQWAGEGVPLIRPMAAAKLVATLTSELTNRTEL